MLTVVHLCVHLVGHIFESLHILHSKQCIANEHNYCYIYYCLRSWSDLRLAMISVVSSHTPLTCKIAVTKTEYSLKAHTFTCDNYCVPLISLKLPFSARKHLLSNRVIGCKGAITLWEQVWRVLQGYICVGTKE